MSCFRAAAVAGGRRAARIQAGDGAQEALGAAGQRGVRLALIEIARAQAHQLSVHGWIGVRSAVRHDGVAMAPGTARRRSGASRGPRSARATHACHSGRSAHGRAMPARTVNSSPAASSVSASLAISSCHRSAVARPGSTAFAPRSPSAAAISCRRSASAMRPARIAARNSRRLRYGRAPSASAPACTASWKRRCWNACSVLWWMNTPIGPWSGSTPWARASARSIGVPAGRVVSPRTLSGPRPRARGSCRCRPASR